eukprot:2953107-Lingulodinium_polyedra.AAC.1
MADAGGGEGKAEHKDKFGSVSSRAGPAGEHGHGFWSPSAEAFHGPEDGAIQATAVSRTERPGAG